MNRSGPYQIEYAHLLTATTLNHQLKAFCQPNQRKKDKTRSILEQHKNILITEYQKMEERAVQEYRDRHSELALKKSLRGKSLPILLSEASAQ